MMQVYLIRNKLTKKLYVGQTIKSLQKRWASHCSSKSNCSYLHRAIKVYGRENFEMVSLRECSSREELNHYESAFIRHFNCFAPCGYNLTTGGEYPNLNSISKAKIAEALKGNTHTRGQKRSDETKTRMSEAKKGKRPTSETKRLMSLNRPTRSIYGFNKLTGEGHFFRCIELARRYGFNPSLIGHVCKGERRTHKKFEWFYFAEGGLRVSQK